MQAYMTRLGTFGYDDMFGLVSAMHSNRHHLGVSELFACGLKAAGIYVARCTPALPLPLKGHRHNIVHKVTLVPPGCADVFDKMPCSTTIALKLLCLCCLVQLCC